LAERAAARDDTERGLAMARALGDEGLTARALMLLAGMVYFERDVASVQRLSEEGLEIARRVGDSHLLGMELTMFALTVPSEDERRRILLEALACFRQAGDHLLTVAALNNLHGLCLHAGLIDEGRRYLEEGIAIAEDIGASLMLYFLRAELAIA